MTFITTAIVVLHSRAGGFALQTSTAVYHIRVEVDVVERESRFRAMSHHAPSITEIAPCFSHTKATSSGCLSDSASFFAGRAADGDAAGHTG